MKDPGRAEYCIVNDEEGPDDPERKEREEREGGVEKREIVSCF